MFKQTAFDKDFCSMKLLFSSGQPVFCTVHATIDFSYIQIQKVHSYRTYTDTQEPFSESKSRPTLSVDRENGHSLKDVNSFANLLKRRRKNASGFYHMDGSLPCQTQLEPHTVHKVHFDVF